MSRIYRVATRRSRLARIQTDEAVAALQAVHPSDRFEITLVETQGDERLDWSLRDHGGGGLFTSALEEALLRGEVDIAVHSAKDLPVDLTEDLKILAYLPRERVEDVLLVRTDIERIDTIATGSPRRQDQLRGFFPQVTWCEIRGNLETRLRKVREGSADATVMAAAGLGRLGLHSPEGFRVLPLSLWQCVPAAGQGAIAIQTRGEMESGFFRGCLETFQAVSLERKVLGWLGGGCQSSSAVSVGRSGTHVYRNGFGHVRIASKDEEVVEHTLRATMVVGDV